MKTVMVVTAAFITAALASPVMAEDSVPNNFGAAACLIQKGDGFMVTKNRFGELSLPMKKIHPEVLSAAEESGVKMDDTGGLARFVARFGAHEELGLPLASITAGGLVDRSVNKKGETLLMFRCASDAKPDMGEVKSANVMGIAIAIVNPKTMTDENGAAVPKFRFESDRNVLLKLLP